MAKRLISTVLTVVMAAVLLTGCVKVVKIGHEGDLTGQKEFNPGDSVEAIWDSEVIPESMMASSQKWAKNLMA